MNVSATLNPVHADVLLFLGYVIKESEEQPGCWTWTKKDKQEGSVFESKEKAQEMAWLHALEAGHVKETGSDKKSLVTGLLLPATAHQRGKHRVGPFEFVTGDAVRVSNKFNLRVVLYGAYNACGLIGTERNGIAILDETRLTVITDELYHEPFGGYCGASSEQVRHFNRILAMPDDELQSLVNGSERLRMPL